MVNIYEGTKLGNLYLLDILYQCRVNISQQC